MTTGNPATMTVSAGMSMADIFGTTCEKLKKCNDDQRTALKSDTRNKSISNYFAKTSVVVHGSLGGGAVVGATSRLLPSRYKHLSKGLWVEKDKKKRREMRESGDSNLCPEPPFKYKKGFRPHQSHCESKILESLFENGPPGAGPLTLNINWQIVKIDKKTKKETIILQKIPCRACAELLCHAQKECKLKVEFCQRGPESGIGPGEPPRPLEC